MIKDSETPIPMQGGGVVVPEGVSFDGVTDYMSRSTDLVGNVDSKTFTFSCLVYRTDKGSNHEIFNFLDSADVGNTLCQLFLYSVNGSVNLTLRDGTSTTAGAYLSTIFVPMDTYTHLLFSVDMTNQSISNLYINDRLDGGNWSQFVNTPIKFSTPLKKIGGVYYTASSAYKGRLSNLFIAREYLDLSIESNRRIFITADGTSTSAYQNWLDSGRGNVMLSLPMKDAATAHLNEAGTGDFVQNGTLATADRGANQDNCVASKFDGVDDNLVGSFSTPNSKTVTFSLVYKHLNSSILLFTLFGGYTEVSTSSDRLVIRMANSSASLVIEYKSTIASKFVIGVEYHMTFSFDLTDALKTRLIVNGFSYTMDKNVFINDFPDMSRTTANIGLSYLSQYGEFYFDTNYIDLATDNPFWDSDTNKPIPVRTAMANLGSNPLICMPISSDNAGANYGSGGSFTVNGGGLVGARGASEYIARSAKFDGVSSYIYADGTAVSDTFSIMLSFQAVSSGIEIIMINEDTNGSYSLDLYLNNNNLSWAINGGAVGVNTTLTVGEYYTVLICSNGGNIKGYINGVNKLDVSVTLASRDFIVFGGQKSSPTAYPFSSNMSNVYISTDYIDFSSEANRNLFINQLGYPRDLTSLITDGTIPTPLVYMKFDDTANLGKNEYGTDFSVVGTVAAGADFNV